MERKDFERYFTDNSPVTDLSGDFLRSVKETSFYAAILVDAFLEEVDMDTVVVACTDYADGRLRRYAIGAKIRDMDQGYLTLIGGLSEQLDLVISLWKPWSETTKEEFKEKLFERGLGHRNRVHITSDDNREGGMEVPIKGHRRRLVTSDLRIEFYPERWRLVPDRQIDKSLDVWILTSFVPRFIEDRAKPLANIPQREMSRWQSFE